MNNIRYADITVLLAGTLGDLQQLFKRLNCHCNNYGLKINLKKTKIMVMNKAQNPEGNLMADDTVIERV